MGSPLSVFGFRFFSLARPQAGRSVASLLLLGAVAWLARAAEPADAGIEFFERRIRPLLAEQCYSCHGEEKQKGHLRLDSPGNIQSGGENGPILVPGKPDDSRLIVAVRYHDVDLQMPPKQRLSARQVADLTEWVKRGAPLPEGEAATGTRTPRKPFQISEQDRQHWAFQPVRKPAVPRATNAIDALVSADLARHGLSLNPEATPRELVRRVYFDLIGLPPSPEEIDAYERSPAPDRYERLLDQLLARPQYGERWARHWLDVVRFAQSNGYERDGEKFYAWRYRDYVIQAFNADKPYDRFIREQLAGDELPDATAETVTATGFHRLGVFDDEPDDKVMAGLDALDDVLSTTSGAFLGLTLGCARCHDHKFDPISQADYYSMLAFFRGVRPFESLRSSPDSPGFAPLVAPAEYQAWKSQLPSALKPLEAQLAGTTNEPDKKRLQGAIQRLQEGSFEWTLAAREAGPEPPPTHILVRGNAATPGPRVEPAFLSVLETAPPKLPQPATNAFSSGRRLALANWIAHPQNPLTARVLVNRVWHHHFGRGLVKTTTDFGRAGSRPTHPELLDWLAAEFIERGWSLKQVHRLILRSRTYRQSSRADNPQALAADPDNRLLWRQNLRRLEAEAIRDNLLSIAGGLNTTMGGRGFFPHLSGEVLAGQSRPGLDWDISSPAERGRRSIYTYVRRTMAIPLLESFDYNNTTSPVGERSTTTVAPQALMLLNDEFLHHQAAALADRVIREAGQEPDAQVRRIYRLAVGRFPTASELAVAQRVRDRQTAAFDALSTRLQFRPEVANALATDYFNKLQPDQFLRGPGSDWNYHRGFWAPPYEGIRVVDRDRAPFALWSGARFTNATISTRLLLSSSCEYAGLLVHARADLEIDHGYEIRWEVRQQQLRLIRHGKNSTSLATAPARIVAGRPQSVRMELHGPRFRVWLDNPTDPALDTEVPVPPTIGGHLGVRTWGGSVSLDDLTVQTGSGETNVLRITPQDSAPPTRRALESLCLLILNLNELVYVD